MSSLKLERSRTLTRPLKLRRSRSPGRWAWAGLALAVAGCASSGAGQAGVGGQVGVAGLAEAAFQEALRPPALPPGTALYDMAWFEVPGELSGRAGIGWRLAFGGPRGSPMMIHVTHRCPLDQPMIVFEGKVSTCFSRIPALDKLGPDARVSMRFVRGRPAGIMFGTRAERGGVVMFVIRDPDREALEAETAFVDPGCCPIEAEQGFPEGAFALTSDVEVVIARSGADLTFRIGDGDALPVEAVRDDRWEVPELHLAFSGVREGETTLLELQRYEQTVRLHPAAPGFAHDYAGLSTAEVLADLTPRLMIALNVPGVSIALVQEHEVAWLGQFGVKTSGSTERVVAGTVFEAASMSKPAYAYPFLRLVEDERIDLDVPLVDYLGGDYIEDEELHRLITARMVLTHTTGFPNWRREGELTVDFRPGTDVRYSGEGFQFLQTAVEAVSAMPMEEFSQRYLLRPLGMVSSSFVWQTDYERSYATGHTASGEPRERRPYIDPNSAFTLYTTPRDYAQVLLEMMRTDRSAPHSLSASTVEEMLAPNELPDGGSRPLAWRMEQHPTGDRFSHSGSNSTGFQCYSEFAPASGNGIVIMTNSSSGSPLWRALMREIGPI